MPAVIFATAYDDHALAAFEHNAVDYVLKPFDERRIQMAVERARERVKAQRAAEMLEGIVPDGDKSVALEALDGLNGRSSIAQVGSTSDRQRLPIKDGQQTQLVAFGDIGWIEAAGDYMCVHVGGETHVLRSTMKDLEQKLTVNFVRVHRSTIVNLDMVLSVDALPKGEARLNLKGGAAIKVSRNYRAAIQHILN
jgi:two-component system LytT family response regulator